MIKEVCINIINFLPEMLLNKNRYLDNKIKIGGFMNKIKYLIIAIIIIGIPSFGMADVIEQEVNCVACNEDLCITSNSECTTVSVGKNVSTDGSTIISYNSDCGGCPFHTTIVPAADWVEGDMRGIMHRGEVQGEMPQVPHTFQYLRSCLPVMNEKGVAVGETTCSIDTSTEYGQEVREVMRSSEGIVDYEYILEVVLERASTAREAVEILGDIIETYKWAPINAENINFADGDEIWIMEVYGHDLWCAFRLADDEVFVSANAARIRDIDFDDEENVMHSPNIISFAVDKGWYDPVSGEPFRPADIYAPNNNVYATRRVWRAYDIMAPSLGLSPHEVEYPQTIVPDNKLSVHDVFKIMGDYYQGTDYDLTVGPAAGPWGNPIRYANSGDGTWERSINMHRTNYFHISQINNNYPDPIKGVAWFGYGAPDSSYIAPLSGTMNELPEFYRTGSRWEPFDRNSGWWINIYVQQMAELHYNEAIKDLYAVRDPKLEMLYEIVPEVQKKATEIYQTDPERGLSLINNFYYQHAVALHESWKNLGDMLLGKYAMGYINFRTAAYPEWWNELIGYGPVER